MDKFKIGDRVIRIRGYWSGMVVGNVGTVTGFRGNDVGDVVDLKEFPGGHDICSLELIENNKNDMTITEMFTLALTPEPQKTFRKLEITNGDNLLTDAGAKIFQTWLLSKHQDDFKKEVCDPMLTEKETK